MKPNRQRPTMKSGCAHDRTYHDALIDLIEEVKREMNKNLLLLAEKIKHMEGKMAQTLQDVIAAITVVDGKVDEVAGKIGDVSKSLTDLSSDFDEAVQTLQDAITAGGDTAPAVEALSGIGEKLSSASEALTTASDALKAIDVKAETISGKPTP